MMQVIDRTHLKSGSSVSLFFDLAFIPKNAEKPD